MTFIIIIQKPILSDRSLIQERLRTSVSFSSSEVFHTLSGMKTLEIRKKDSDMDKMHETRTELLFQHLTACSKSANKPSTSCVRTACPKLSISMQQAVNNL